MPAEETRKIVTKFMMEIDLNDDRFLASKEQKMNKRILTARIFVGNCCFRNGDCPQTACQSRSQPMH